MNFDLNEDQMMLRALVERFVGDRYDLDRRRGYLAQDQGFCAQNWALLGDIGLIAAPFSRAAGGIGGDAVETIILHEALGRGLVVEPLIDSALLAGGLFERSAAPALRDQWIGALTRGEKRIVLAHRERAARDNFDWVESRAVTGAEGRVRLSGEKVAVVNGLGADAYIVSARGGAEDGVGLYVLPAGQPGIMITPYRQIDGSVAVRLTLDGAEAGATLAGGLDALRDAETRADLARCAEALGIMETLFAATLDYLRQRHQFGQPLSSFQALQHRMAAQYVHLEEARSLLYAAAMADTAERDTWHRAVAGARAFIGEVSVALGHEAIQLHGGMGVSDELMIGHAHKRLLQLSRHPQSPDAALDRYAR